MNECSDEMKECIAQLSVLGGEIHLLCPTPSGVSTTHTHIKIEKHTKIVCGPDFMKTYYHDSPDRICLMIPYSSIAYIYVKKK